MIRKKTYKAVLLSSVALVASATPALAVVEIGTLAIQAFGALLAAAPGAATAAAAAPIIGSITLAQIVGTTVLVGAQIGIGLLAQGGGQRAQGVDPTYNRQIFETGNSGQWRCIGRAKIGGVVLYGNTKDYRRHRIVARCKGPIDAVESNFLGGREVTVDENGNVVSPPYAKPGGSWVTIRDKIGDGTETAWPETVADFPGLWTENHRVRGIAQSQIIYTSPGISNQLHFKLYGSGYAESQQIIRGELLYDPRNGLTRWSDNGILAILHIMTTDWRFNIVAPSGLVIGGFTVPGTDQSDFDLEAIAAEANKADALVQIKGGGFEKRSRFWGAWEERTLTRNDLLQQALLSVGAELYTTASNKIGIRLVEENALPEFRIVARDIKELSLKSGPESVERPNVCKLSYYSPERGYEVAEINLVSSSDNPAAPSLPWATVQNEIDRTGEKIFDLKLPFCPSASQAQRIARRLFAEARAASGIVTTNMVGVATWRKKVVAIEDIEGGPDIVARNARARLDFIERKCEIPFRVQPQLSPWNPATDEAAAPQNVPEIGFVPTIARPTIAENAVSVTLYGSGGRELRVSYTVPPAGISVEALYRVENEVAFGPWQPMTEYVVLPSLAYASAPANVEGKTIEFRSRYFNNQDEAGEFSPVSTFVVNEASETPPPPAILRGDIVFGETTSNGVTITAPAVLNLVAITKQGGIGPNGVSPPDTAYNGTVAARPGDVISYAVSQTSETTYTYRASSVGSSGNTSSAATATWQTPPPGGG